MPDRLRGQRLGRVLTAIGDGWCSPPDRIGDAVTEHLTRGDPFGWHSDGTWELIASQRSGSSGGVGYLACLPETAPLAGGRLSSHGQPWPPL